MIDEYLEPFFLRNISAYARNMHPIGIGMLFCSSSTDGKYAKIYEATIDSYNEKTDDLHAKITMKI